MARLLEDPDSDSATIAAVARELKIDDSSALRRVRAAIDRGYLKNLEEREGRPARLVMGEPLPDNVEVLPPVDALRGCSTLGLAKRPGLTFTCKRKGG